MDFQPVDADNHYYEPLDAFTRHLDRAFTYRGVHVVQDGRRVQILIGGRINRFVPNATFDPIIVPGCIESLFSGQIPEGVDPRSLMQVERLRPEYHDPNARVASLDSQGLDSVVLFPTLGCGVEQALVDDIPATMASISAFNAWLAEDWGYSYRGRLLAVPMLSLADPEEAVREVDRVLERGARMVHVRPAPVPGPNGTSRSLGDATHDPVWARLAEASVPVAFHLGDSGYERFAAAWGGKPVFEAFSGHDVLGRILVADRAIHDAMASLIVHGVFTPHPALRVASIENGSDWVRLLVKRLRKQANQTRSAFPNEPLATVREHVWVTPYVEEDLHALADLIGVDRILFGSDWPHGEGCPQPMDFVRFLQGFDEAAVHRIMRDNCLALLGSGTATGNERP